LIADEKYSRDILIPDEYRFYYYYFQNGFYDPESNITLSHNGVAGAGEPGRG
jgi:hypothetical protein